MNRLFHELTYTAKVSEKSCQERNSNSHVRVTGPLLYQLSNRVSWEQYARSIQFKCTRDSHNLTLDIREDVQCFDSVSTR